MSDIRKIEPNVWSFLDAASSLFGRMQAQAFSQRIYAEMVERGIESPIEDMVYIALNIQCASRGLEINQGPDLIDGGMYWPDGIQVSPQASIGKYRVDFLITSNNSEDRVVIELDGHAFHDKDKRQRSYEKKRDRDLVKAGHKVLHYTGSDVVADPYRVAFEILEVLGLLDEEETYDATNPVGFD